MPSFFRTAPARHAHAYQPGDHDRAKQRLAAKIEALPSDDAWAHRIAQAIDNCPGNIDQKFSRASHALVNLVTELYQSQGERRPHCLGSLINESKHVILACYGRVVRSALQDHYWQDLPGQLLHALIDSKGAPQTTLFKEMMYAVEAERFNKLTSGDNTRQAADQVKDLIKEYFQAKGVTLYDVEASAIKTQLNSFLTDEFNAFSTQRQRTRHAQRRQHVSAPNLQTTESSPAPRLKTVRFNPLVTVHVHRAPAEFWSKTSPNTNWPGADIALFLGTRL